MSEHVHREFYLGGTDPGHARPCARCESREARIRELEKAAQAVVERVPSNPTKLGVLHPQWDIVAHGRIVALRQLLPVEERT